MTQGQAGRRRRRGTVDELPSGALRVRVYGGKDPVSGTRHDLVEIVQAGPKQTARAEAARTRLLNQLGLTTHRMYTRYLEKYVRPLSAG